MLKFGYFGWMQFKDSKVVLFHGVVDLRKGAAGLVALVDDPEPHTWYLFSNRSRTLMKCVRLDRSGERWERVDSNKDIIAGLSVVVALRFWMRMQQRICVRERNLKFTINLFLCFHLQWIGVS